MGTPCLHHRQTDRTIWASKRTCDPQEPVVLSEKVQGLTFGEGPTVLRFAKTLDKKCSSPLCVRLARSWFSTPGAAFTKASISKGRANTSFGSPEGYETGAGQVPHRESTGNHFMGDLSSGRIGTFNESRAVHTLVAALRFDRSIEARSARIAWGFCGARVSVEKAYGTVRGSS